MKIQIIFALLISFSLSAMQNDKKGAQVFSTLIRLIEKGDATAASAYLDNQYVSNEIVFGDNSFAIYNLSQALDKAQFKEKHPTLYKEFETLFLHRSCQDPQYNAWSVNNELDLMWENTLYQNSLKDAEKSEKAPEQKDILEKMQ